MWIWSSICGRLKHTHRFPKGKELAEKRMKARTRWGAVLKILYAKILYDYVEVEEVRNGEN